MSVQPDIIWNEQCLGIRIGEQVCIYLKKHNAEYQRLQKKILEFTEKYPVIETFMETNQSISLTEEEHKQDLMIRERMKTIWRNQQFDEVETSPVMENLWKAYQKNYYYAANIS